MVADNRTGFDLEEARLAAGLGLISMRERAYLAGGEFAVSSKQFLPSTPVGWAQYIERIFLAQGRESYRLWSQFSLGTFVIVAPTNRPHYAPDKGKQF